MFRRAYEVASAFTVPVVLSQLLEDGTVSCAVGAAVVVDEAGWIVTAGHMLEPLQAPGPNVRASSYWFGRDGWSVEAWEVLPDADLAAGRLGGFAAGQIPGYPLFEAGALAPGSSLCRLGFPFHEVAAAYDAATGRFVLAPETLPIPRFPNEGILTRLHELQGSDAPFPVRFVETSSPGLRGQSGGPIFDLDGHVWGIQSRTTHISLGFDPVVETGGRAVTEHQFLNVGVGASSDTVVAFLRHVGAEPQTTERV